MPGILQLLVLIINMVTDSSHRFQCKDAYNILINHNGLSIIKHSIMPLLINMKFFIIISLHWDMRMLMQVLMVSIQALFPSFIISNITALPCNLLNLLTKMRFSYLVCLLLEAAVPSIGTVPLLEAQIQCL